MTNLILTEKKQYWLKHCRDYECFSGSQKECAKTHELKITDLYTWRQTLRGKVLKKYKMVASMGDVGACWDNAVVERFFGSLKHDWVFKVSRHGII